MVKKTSERAKKMSNRKKIILQYLNDNGPTECAKMVKTTGDWIQEIGAALKSLRVQGHVVNTGIYPDVKPKFWGDYKRGGPLWAITPEGKLQCE